jgi:endonuclease III
MNDRRLRKVFDILFKTHGPQHWWPARGRFEVMVGAVLTQNTAWTNVERAIAALSAAGALEPEAMLALSDAELARLIRPSGYFNVKAARLKALCRWYLAHGGWRRLRHWSTGRLREALLAVHGIGPRPRTISCSMPSTARCSWWTPTRAACSAVWATRRPAHPMTNCGSPWSPRWVRTCASTTNTTP